MIIRTLSAELVQKLLKTPLQLFKGKEGWWITIKGGRRIFIPREKIISTLRKTVKSGTESKSTQVIKNPLRYLIDNSVPFRTSHPELHDTYVRSVQSVIQKHFGRKDLNLSANILVPNKIAWEGLQPVLGDAAAVFDPQTRSIILSPRSFADFVRFYDPSYLRKFLPKDITADTLEELQRASIEHNTIAWRNAYATYGELLHEYLHSIGTPYTATGDEWEMLVAEGLTQYHMYQVLPHTPYLMFGEHVVHDLNNDLNDQAYDLYRTHSYNVPVVFFYQVDSLTNPNFSKNIFLLGNFPQQKEALVRTFRKMNIPVTNDAASIVREIQQRFSKKFSSVTDDKIFFDIFGGR